MQKTQLKKTATTSEINQQPMSSNINTKKPLGLFSLIMINVIAVDNLRSLTAGAEYGFALVFFYLLAALLFFIPTILVTAELSTGWPNTGGVYIWIREAFGPKFGFLIIWLQWIYNIVWYPTIFTFIAGILATLIQPALINNKIYMLIVILTTYWGATFLNCLGLRISSFTSALGAIFGTMIPMILIAGLGLFWVYTGAPRQIHFTVQEFFPNLTSLNNLAFLTNVLFGLMGMEMSAVHAGDVKNPTRNYPRALVYSTVIILATLISACLAIAIVVPNNELNLVSGLMDAFQIFFHAYHLTGWLPVLGILIILGSLTGAIAWIVGSARGLFIASKDNQLPKTFTRCNAKNMPTGILLIQGLIVTFLCLVFFIMPTVNSSYWVLSNLTAQLALVVYIFIFAAAIRLHYKYPKTERAFKIPGGAVGIWLVSCTGIVTCIFAIFLGFLPPSQMGLTNVINYEAVLIFGIIICCLPPFFLTNKRRPLILTEAA